MGRGQLPMELIGNKKSRNKTFRTRKESLKKKLYEITTLCGGEACMIVYGPCDDDGIPMELDIWPEQAHHVKRIIKKYKDHRAMSKGRKENSSDLLDFFEKRNQEIYDKIIRLRRANAKAKYPVWNHRVNNVSLDRLRDILDGLDSKINSAKICTDSAKENQWPRKIGEATTKMIGCTHMQPSPQSYSTNSEHRNDMQLSDAIIPQSYSTNSEHGNMQLNDDAIDYLELIPPPLDFYMPENDMFEQDFQTPPPVDINSKTSPTMTMAMSENYHHGSSSSTNNLQLPLLMSPIDYDQYHYGSSSSTNNLQYTPLFPPIDYDPTSGLLEDVVFNTNPNKSSVMGNYSPPRMQQSMQQQQQSVDGPIISSNNVSQVMMPSSSSWTSPTMATMSEYYHYGSSSSTNNLQYTPSKPPIDYDLMLFVMGDYSPPSMQQPFVQRSIVSSNAPQVMMSSDFSQMNYPQTNVVFNNYPKASSVMGNYSPPSVQQQFVQRSIVSSNAPNYSPPSMQQQFVQRSIVSSNAPNYSPPSMQQQFVQRSIVSSNAPQAMMSSDFSQVNDLQTNENSYEISGFQNMNKRSRYY